MTDWQMSASLKFRTCNRLLTYFCTHSHYTLCWHNTIKCNLEQIPKPIPDSYLYSQSLKSFEYNPCVQNRLRYEACGNRPLTRKLIVLASTSKLCVNPNSFLIRKILGNLFSQYKTDSLCFILSYLIYIHVTIKLAKFTLQFLITELHTNN